MADRPTGIRFITNLAEARAALTRRRGFEETVLSSRMQDGIRRVFGGDLDAHQVVDRILTEVQRDGDEAIRRFTKSIDGVSLNSLEVPKTDWEAAFASIDPDLQRALRVSAEQIEAFHRRQLRTSWM